MDNQIRHENMDQLPAPAANSVTFLLAQKGSLTLRTKKGSVSSSPPPQLAALLSAKNSPCACSAHTCSRSRRRRVGFS